jgi:CheY-like chemotaxis protein
MNEERRSKPHEILIVEDSAGDLRLMQEAFSESIIKSNITGVSDGEEALAYLRREGAFANAARPDLILLDLNLPRKDGRATLAEIKGDPKLRRIPVIMLTGSKAEEDILKAYNLNVNSYITKPSTHDELLTMVRGIEEFWMTVVHLPKD